MSAMKCNIILCLQNNCLKYTLHENMDLFVVAAWAMWAVVSGNCWALSTPSNAWQTSATECGCTWNKWGHVLSHHPGMIPHLLKWVPQLPNCEFSWKLGKQSKCYFDNCATLINDIAVTLFLLIESWFTHGFFGGEF